MTKTYEKSKQKRKLEEYIRTLLPKDFHSDVLTLLGPNPEIPLKFLEPITSKVISYEIDGKVFEKQKYLDILDFPGIEEVELNHDDILYAEPTRYIDLDLCPSIVTQAKLVKTLFLKQEKEFIKDKDPKVFKFTLSARLGLGRGKKSEGKSMIYDCIEPFLANLLDIKLGIGNQSRWNSIIEYPILTLSDIYNIKLFSYEDGGPMLTILIQY